MNEERMKQSVHSAPSTPYMWWRLLILCAVFVFVYHETITSLFGVWMNRPEYSHGVLVPFISIYMIWTQRQKLRSLSIMPELIFGSIFLLGSIFVFLAGTIGGIRLLQQISIIAVIPGLVLMVFGRGYLKKLFFPLAYLIFMIPALDLIFDNIRGPFQLFTAVSASKILSVLNFPVYQHGLFLELPEITLEVAKACSGVQYMISILAIGLPLAYFTQKTLIRRIALVMTGIIIGIIANPIRITLIGVWAYHGGSVVHGPMHIFQGLSISVVGYSALFLFAWVFAKIPYKKAGNAQAGTSLDSFTTTGSNPRKFNTAWLLSVLILMAVPIYLNFYNPKPVALGTPLTQFPPVIGQWTGTEIHDLQSSFEPHGVDSRVFMEYHDHSDRRIRLYIGHFESQRQDKELVDYRLQDIYDRSRLITIPADAGSQIQANKVVLKDKPEQTLLLYWYILGDHFIAEKHKLKLLTTANGLIRGRTDGSVIIVSINFRSNENERKAMEDALEFTATMLPALKNSLFAVKRG